MALDVQPLSRGRRVLMVLVMLALLGSSLGLAQWLVARRGAEKAGAYFELPPGVAQMRINDSAQESLVVGRYDIAQANWKQGPRQFAAFCFPDPPGGSRQMYAGMLFSRLADLDPAQPRTWAASTLAGYPAVQLGANSQTDDISTFTIMRLTEVSGYIVAFCFSGNGDFTDEDWRFFDDYCAHKIRIQEAPASRRKG